MTATTLRRRRVNTTVPTPRLGVVLTELRKARNMTQTALAAQAGLRGSSVLSRLEAGRMENLSRDLIESLAELLGVDANELWSAANTLPPAAVEQLAPHYGAYEPTLLREHTMPAIRRIGLRAEAEQVLRDASLEAVPQIRIEHLVRAVPAPGRRLLWSKRAGDPPVYIDDTTIRIAVAAPIDTSDIEDEQALAATAIAEGREKVRTRFLVAHAVAHAILEDEQCEWPTMHEAEIRADELACHLLVPAAVLAKAFDRASREDLAGDADGWHPGTFGLLDRVAGLVGAPSWVVIRRIADEDLLTNRAQDST